MQVKIAEHVLTQHKVAIKILNKRKIKQQDMEEKGMLSLVDDLYQWEVITVLLGSAQAKDVSSALDSLC